MHFIPFLTGLDACQSGIYGLRWFDKEREKGQLRNYVGRTNVQMNYDVKASPQNLFELAGTSYTCSINSYMNRGVKESVKTGFAHTTAKYEGKIWLSNLASLPWIGKKVIKNHFLHETAVANLALTQLESNPKVQWITFASPDAYNHVNGTDSIYHHLLRHIDFEIGRILAKCRALGHEQRAIAVVSDHGIQDVHTNLDVCKSLKQNTGLSIERGKSAVLYSTDLTTPASKLSTLDAYFVINGNLSAYIYVLDAAKKKLGKQSLERLKLKNGTTINLPQELIKTEGIELCLLMDEVNGDMYILSKKGSSAITKSGNKYAYRIVKGMDPLGYENHSEAKGRINNGFYFRRMAQSHPLFRISRCHLPIL
ncbi:MAG: alkaline phosphatase family protein [Saprospiraceae bacterium]|nr:alkaline phosphatase family protein [Saprospiraceae bacterium]